MTALAKANICPRPVDGPYTRRIAGVLMTIGAGSLAGFFGVMVAAHLYTPAAVGFASVALAGAPFVNVFANLGLVPTVLRRLARSDAPSELISVVYLVGGITTLVVGAIYSGFMPVGTAGGGIVTGLIARGAFVALALGMFFHAVQDSALFALDLSGRAALRTIATQVSRVGLIVALAHVTQAGIVIAAAVSYLVVTVWVQRRVLGPRLGKIRFSKSSWKTLLGGNLSYLSASYALDVLHWLPAALLPVLIGHYLSMGAAGLYYVASLLLGVAMLPLAAIITGEIAGQSAVRDVSTVQRKTLLLSLGIGMAATAILASVAPVALGAFGSIYQIHATTLLRLLTLTVIPGSFRQIYVTRARLQLTMRPAILVLAVSTVSMVLLSWLLIPTRGLTGLGTAACLAEWTAAALAAFLWWRSTRYQRQLPSGQVSDAPILFHPNSVGPGGKRCS